MKEGRTDEERYVVEFIPGSPSDYKCGAGSTSEDRTKEERGIRSTPSATALLPLVAQPHFYHCCWEKHVAQPLFYRAVFAHARIG